MTPASLLPHPAVFESIMLICFGLAWPASIFKSYRSRTNRGKSIFFLYIILFGYANGILFQALSFSASSKILILFFINSALVAIDILIYYRNAHLMKQENKIDESE